MPNQRACLCESREGQKVERQNVVGSAEHDLLSATDWLFPQGLDHHEMFTGMPLLRPVIQKVVRRLSGLGTFPSPPVPAPSKASKEEALAPKEVDLLVVGSGASGLAAAQRVRAAGREVLVLEAMPVAGGRARSPLQVQPFLIPASLEIWTKCSAEWIVPSPSQIKPSQESVDEEAPGVPRDTRPRLELVAQAEDRLLRIRSRALLLATGCHTATPLFENNDLPGLYDARWATELLLSHKICVGQRLLLCGVDSVTSRLARLFEAAGATVIDCLPAEAALARGSTRVVAAHGSNSLSAVSIEREGVLSKLACDALIYALPGTPALDLATAAGVPVRYVPTAACFLARCSPEGATSRQGLFVTGSLTGRLDPQEAAQQGQVTGAALVEYLKEQERCHAT